MVVKRVGNAFHMSASYWDAGYVVLDVTDVAKPALVAQSDYARTDPALVGTPFAARAPEGNGHQSEWTKDHTHLIGTDEDFAPLHQRPVHHRRQAVPGLRGGRWRHGRGHPGQGA
jgi:hypothetical protein